MQEWPSTTNRTGEMDFQGEQPWHGKQARSEAAERPGRTRIGMAAERGEFRKVEAFIEAGDDPNEPDDFQETPLYIAAGVGALVIVKYLVEEHGADVSHRNHDKWTPLVWAVARGHLKIAKYLVARGSNVNAKTSLGWRAIHFAGMLARADIVHFLLEQGAHVGVANVHGCTPIYAAATQEIKAMLEGVEDQEFKAGEEARRHLQPMERVQPYGLLHTKASRRIAAAAEEDLGQFDPGFWRPPVPSLTGPRLLPTRMGDEEHAQFRGHFGSRDQRARPPQDSFRTSSRYVGFNTGYTKDMLKSTRQEEADRAGTDLYRYVPGEITAVYNKT